MAHIFFAYFIYKLELGHDGTDVKSWENHFLGLFDPLSEGVQKNSVNFWNMGNHFRHIVDQIGSQIEKKIVKKKLGAPGFEPKTPHTLGQYHTSRPTSLEQKIQLNHVIHIKYLVINNIATYLFP